MKIKTLTLLLVLFGSITMACQPLNEEQIIKGVKPFLLGEINKEGLLHENYRSWFLSQYDAYKLQDSLIQKFSKELRTYEILIFMGTWCGDSRREVPRIYKVLEKAAYPMSQLKIVALSSQRGMYKQSPGQHEKGLNIHRVPTIILYKGGKEVNRIVESPVTTLEEDIAHILIGNYTPNYAAVIEIDKILKEKNPRDLREQLKTRSRWFKENVKNIYELNTYARVLESQNGLEESLAVLELNTRCFPDNAFVYSRLAAKLYSSNQKKRALENYNKALELDPDNKKLIDLIDSLKNEG